MSNVDEIKAAIETLPPADYSRLRQWFDQRDWDRWDRQIEADSRSGKLDFLTAEALAEKADGSLRDL